MEEYQPMSAESVEALLREAGAETMIRAGRSESYGAPRDFSFEVKGVFGNGMGLHVVARQFNYRDPWEAEGRVNDMVDVSLLRDGSYSPLPKGYPFSRRRIWRRGWTRNGCGDHPGGAGPEPEDLPAAGIDRRLTIYGNMPPG